jgi:TolA-binding protein
MILTKQQQYVHNTYFNIILFLCISFFISSFSNAFTLSISKSIIVPSSFHAKTSTKSSTKSKTRSTCTLISTKISTVTTTKRNAFNNDDDSDDSNNNNNNTDKAKEEAESLRIKAEQLRKQIRELEEKLPNTKKLNNNDEYIRKENDNDDDHDTETKSLKNKRVLVIGANGRLGSMVTRYLLRNHPEVKEVVASVHYVGEATTRGYGRLSYEVGAEDGVGRIGAAWSPEEERNASFEFSEEMKDYNLQNLVCEIIGYWSIFVIDFIFF